MDDDTIRRANLLDMLNRNIIVSIQDCSFTSNPKLFTCGDLDALGLMDKKYTYDEVGEVDGWNRTYLGDSPIMVSGSVIKQGGVLI